MKEETKPEMTAEEIIESILESLGDPINIHNHAFEIRPYTVDHKTEWWIFHKEVASGEPLAQWLDKFAALHAQQKSEIAQRCPVCGGNGLVPNGFYNTVTGIGSTTSIVPETCRTCNGTGVILPSYLHAQKIADKMVEEKCAKCKHRGLPDSINEALNSGDGVYRP